ncbi:hypothetical protein BK784_21230 [Bacillus thuringiensis serovar medellin]|uniref:Uncharacterized protein n=1 Tax=Bacillus thuringiensis subsp. medellin TaxID=79672 RepID=A0A9X6REE9_BACTV|nr:hypothetical protein [Bacillus thuringiensis]OUB94143.1 hypothetical protein BK784_21230 [Bacillus thuringiensis serovar medellin]
MLLHDYPIKTQEILIVFELLMIMNKDNVIQPGDRELYEICGYGGPRYFKKHLDKLIHLGIINKKEINKKVILTFNKKLVAAGEFGPKIFI